MAHTNSTTHYSLPQFITTDKPAWLTDVNNAFTAIDTAIYNAKKAGDDAQADATQALTDAGTAQTKANTADSKAGGAIASIAADFLDSATYDVGDKVMYNNLLYICHTAVNTPGAWTGSSNWSRTDINSVMENTSLNDLDGVNISGSINDKVLAYNGTYWTNTALFKIKSYSKTYSVGASDNVWIPGSDVITDVPAGYSIIAIVGFNTGVGFVYPVSIRPLGTDNYAFGMRNITNVAQSGTLTVAVLMVKSGLIEVDP